MLSRLLLFSLFLVYADAIMRLILSSIFIAFIQRVMIIGFGRQAIPRSFVYNPSGLCLNLFIRKKMKRTKKFFEKYSNSFVELYFF